MPQLPEEKSGFAVQPWLPMWPDAFGLTIVKGHMQQQPQRQCQPGGEGRFLGSPHATGVLGGCGKSPLNLLPHEEKNLQTHSFYSKLLGSSFPFFRLKYKFKTSPVFFLSDGVSGGACPRLFIPWHCSWFPGMCSSTKARAGLAFSSPRGDLFQSPAPALSLPAPPLQTRH